MNILKFLFILSLYVPCCLADEKINLQYQGYVGGLNGLGLDISITLRENNTYTINSTAKTKGLIGWVYASESSFVTNGKIVDGMLVPLNYKAEKTANEKTRVTEIDYDSNGKIVEKRYTKNNSTSVSDMTEFQEIAEGAYDYQSFLLALFLEVKKQNRCDANLGIFNGKVLKKLIFADNGFFTMKKDDYYVFEGQAKECLLTVDEETLKDDDIAWLFKDEGDEKQKPMKIWLTDSYASVPVMVGAELGSIGYGKIYLYLDKILIDKSIDKNN